MKESGRERNRRGEGGKLRDDILTAAAALLERTGNEEAVTLRAVAREVGISAPSIYSHFPDGREAIVEAVVDQAFADFNAAIQDATDAAIAAGAGPLERVRAGCAAYLRFAAERPNRYKLLFERQHRIGGDVPDVQIVGFDLLVRSIQDCVAAGISASTDPARDATAIWLALHGYATLPARLPMFPWPEREALLDRIIDGLAEITVEDIAEL
ncbi:MAG TPA: TetR/AcrR family transcriptional regulator [Streptosporangiaceae bacterium]|nr:TetR/AcrR family transcriptional regulator [Streptosporangiaceae bacterium]